MLMEILYHDKYAFLDNKLFRKKLIKLDVSFKWSFKYPPFRTKFCRGPLNTFGYESAEGQTERQTDMHWFYIVRENNAK